MSRLQCGCDDQFPEHSGQMFDWWRCSEEGRIVQAPKDQPPAPPTRPFPLRTDQLCWPMYQASRFAELGSEKPKTEEGECDVSKEFWPNTELCWPMYQASRFAELGSEKPKTEEGECDVSKEFWPNTDVIRGHKTKLEHARPPWIPASNPSNCHGTTKYAPPYKHNCGGREKPVVPFISRP
ncbi:hypothetical protein PoB_007126300 [Plakobranchus ocellatus]|uniref:Uncharacterized protein n=1 Tax=Plakobranchus ocellatus TaxID=259542 RepID=A0AAV4DKH9_9GAST|nr:hypothetical protein PoB_007126300 [Plakobranchus ocellatus]